jgi:Carboxypeptidase regulatory-like domain
MTMHLARASLFMRAWPFQAAFLCFLLLVGVMLGQEAPGAAQPPSVQRIPGHMPAANASLQGTVRDRQTKLGVPGVKISLIRAGTIVGERWTDAEGIFRFVDLATGTYELKAEKEGFQTLDLLTLRINGPETTDLALEPIAGESMPTKGPSGVPGAAPSPPAPPLSPTGSYPGLRTSQAPSSPGPLGIAPEQVPPESANFSKEPNRWDVPMPAWDRYGKGGEFPYTQHHWYDPFNRSRLKGDEPIFGQSWFFDFTGTSITGLDVRRLPVPSGVSAEQSDSADFFGRGEQGFASQSFRLSFDLFEGDTSFRPVDFRIRFTPEFNLNFLQTRERGLVNVDVRDGTNRFDFHTGLQEGFVEAKIRDLSPNFDFVSIRAGIQQFVSDFRGFIFAEEQPGVRIFGNLRSNRINYNLAYFYFLEKNTNSGLNTFDPRHQQVYIGNVYIQDSFFKGYTTEFSFHYNRDDPTNHYDDNGFLVRPAPIGDVVNNGVLQHGIRAYYLGWASNGHIGRLNVSHAFYQALGHDTLNPIAGRRVDIDGRMAALELSVDKDWARFRSSFFWASGDPSNRSDALGLAGRGSTARGFDTIVDETNFAGGAFSFFDQQGIRLTSTGVALTNPGSLLVSLRSNKEEGQANFVNPGIYIFNAGADFNVTPKLRAFVNANYLQFDRTEPLQILLFQPRIRHSIGTDTGLGIQYRPPLTENIVITSGISNLVPGVGFEDIFNKRVLISGFTTIRLTF